MASYYPEGECFFLRSSLRYANNWSADNREQFYSHFLVEYHWNEWVTINQSSASRPHTRSKLMSGKGAWWNTTFCDWDRFYVGESAERNTTNMLRVHSHQNSLNWNECRDLDKGGPRKYCLRPVRIHRKETQWLWIDATIPIRAIYFPVCQVTDEAFPDLCTYVVLDFKFRSTITVANVAGGFEKFSLTRERGLGWNDHRTWGFKVPEIITYLTIPPKLRNPQYGIYHSAIPGNELFVCADSRRIWSGSVLHTSGFYREIDLASVMSATFGVEVGWRPYQFSSFILNLVLHVVELGLGFIPGAGPLLSVAFGMGVQLLQDPDSFRAENVLDLGAAILETLIATSSSSKKFIAPDFLPAGTYRPIPETRAILTNEERDQRKKVGEELNALLTQTMASMAQNSLKIQPFSDVRDELSPAITREADMAELKISVAGEEDKAELKISTAGIHGVAELNLKFK